ncbi:MAG: type I-D CRISPR-associated helicase Cas3' [Candidatus Methanofastidiosia archaeon]
MKFSVNGTKVRRSPFNVLGKKLDLYPHQLTLLKEWPNHRNFVISTMTGSGKTAAALLPLLERKEKAIFVYPTNALIRNQLSSMCKILGEWLQLKYFVETFPKEFLPDLANLTENEKYARSYSDAEVRIAIIDSEILERTGRSQPKGEALLRILSSSPDIILTNPDTLFYLLSLKYSRSMENLQRILAYHLVIDEFHMYAGIELCNLLYMLKFSQELIGAFRKKIFLSATPSSNVLEKLRFLFGEIYEIGLETSVRGFTAVHKIDVELAFYEPFLSIEDSEYSLEAKILRAITELKEQFPEMKRASPDLIPCVVIVNSVVQARAIEQLLADQLGVTVCPYRGLMNKRSRESDFRKVEVLVGTSAIEVGIDFDCAYLLMETGDASSFIQRFGRIGRHQSGSAIIFCEYFKKKGLEDEIGFSRILERDEFIGKVLNVFPVRDSYVWFIDTKYGLLTVKLLSEAFLKKIGQSKADEDVIAELRNRIHEALDKIRELLNVGEFELNILWRKYGDCLLEHFGFRSSLPSVDVFDLEEYKNKREPIYSADLLTLLKRGTPLSSAKKYLFDHKEFFGECYIRDVCSRYYEKPILFVENYKYSYKVEGQICDIDKFNKSSINEILINKGGKKDWNIRLILIREKSQPDISKFFQNQIYILIGQEAFKKLDWRIRGFRLRESGFMNSYAVLGADALVCKALVDQEISQG